MRRHLSLLLVVLMVISLSGCGAGTNTNSNTSYAETQNTETPAVSETEPAEPVKPSTSSGNTSEPAETAGQMTSDTKILVVYFSRTGEQYTVGVIDEGNTAIVAKMIAEKTGADLFEILPETDYPYTYAELTDVAKKEQNEKARPAIKEELPDLSQYDTIFIGAPVWWGDWPMIMYTFFENADLAGKNLVPFSTHEGSGLSGFDRKLASAVPDATVLTGQAFRGNDCQNRKDSVSDAVDKWLSGLGF